MKTILTAEEKKKKVLRLYRERKVSLQKAASLIGIPIIEMLELLEKEGLYLDYTKEELKEDLKGLPRE